MVVGAVAIEYWFVVGGCKGVVNCVYLVEFFAEAHKEVARLYIPVHKAFVVNEL